MEAQDVRLTPAGNPSRAAYYREYRRRRRKAKEQAAIERERQERVAPNLTDAPPHLVVQWIEDSLKVPTGPLTGRPFRVDRWQADWLAGALAPGCREAGLSVSRKNGKSGFIGSVIAAGLIGVLNRPGWRAVVTSLTGLLAKELREAIMLTLIASGLAESVKLYKSPPPGAIEGRDGARVDFLAADKATGHAIGADLAIIDEAGLLQEADRPLWNALYSSISGRNGKLWAISIQGDGPMFAELEKRADSESVHWERFSADEGADIFSEDQWRKANPGLIGGIKSFDYMRDTAARAKGSPGNELHFRAYDLNMNVDPARETIVGLTEYQACMSLTPQLEGDLIVTWDLGGSASMTAAAIYAPSTGGIRVFGAFPEVPPLSERARTDRMGTLYDRMVREGELTIFPGRVTPVAPFVQQVLDFAASKGQVIMMGADRYRRAEAQQAFEDAGVPMHIPITWRGQGAAAKADGSHDVRAFQKAILGRKLHVGASVMLQTAVAQSMIRYDNAGNPALDKVNAKARIDALSASVIAVGLGTALRERGALQLSVV